MCGVGKEIAYVKCEAVSGPTSATLTTEVTKVLILELGEN